MPAISTKRLKSLPPNLLKGQLWQHGERYTRIGHVGRLLVEHRAVTPSRKRAISPVYISAIRDVQQFLTKNKAALIENS